MNKCIYGFASSRVKQFKKLQATKCNFAYSFIQQVFKRLLCARHCSRPWGYHSRNKEIPMSVS